MRHPVPAESRCAAFLAHPSHSSLLSIDSDVGPTSQSNQPSFVSISTSDRASVTVRCSATSISQRRTPSGNASVAAVGSAAVMIQFLSTSGSPVDSVCAGRRAPKRSCQCPNGWWSQSRLSLKPARPIACWEHQQVTARGHRSELGGMDDDSASRAHEIRSRRRRRRLRRPAMTCVLTWTRDGSHTACPCRPAETMRRAIAERYASHQPLSERRRKGE